MLRGGKCWVLSCVRLFSNHGLSKFSPGSLVHGTSQARLPEWVAISFSRGTSWLRDQTWVSCTAGRCFTIWATREASWVGWWAGGESSKQEQPRQCIEGELLGRWHLIGILCRGWIPGSKSRLPEDSRAEGQCGEGVYGGLGEAGGGRRARSPEHVKPWGKQEHWPVWSRGVMCLERDSLAAVWGQVWGSLGSYYSGLSSRRV